MLFTSGIKKKQKGIVLLIAAIVVMVALSFLGLASLYQVTTAVKVADSEIYEKKALYLAEAGIEAAMWRLDNDNDWSDGIPADFSGSIEAGSSFNVALTGRAKDSIQIESTGIASSTGGQVTRRITVKVSR